MKKIMYFSTKTCGPCKMFKPVVQSVSNQLGQNVEYIDAHDNANLASKYGITSVPTIIIEQNGEQTFRRSGVMSNSDLISAFSK